MDPNATLKRIRDLIGWYETSKDGDYASLQTMKEYADEMNQLVTSLDEWLSQGGFLPKQWKTWGKA